MLNAQPSPVMSPDTKELTVPPTSGLAPTLTPVDLKLPPAVTQCVPSMQPLVQFEPQLLAILSDIDATPSPVASPATATQQSVDASPLTARALRYHRRDAFRMDRNNVAPVPSPSSTDPLYALGAEIHEKDRLDFTPAPPRELLHPTIQNKIPSLNPEQYRSTSFHSLPRTHFEYNTPATFARATQALHMTEQRSLFAGLRSLPRVLPPLLPREPSAAYHRLPRHLLPPRPPLRDFDLPLLEPPLPAWPRNLDTLRGLPPLWPRPLSGRFPAPALIAPTAYARTPLCLRGPVWATLTDPRHPPPTSATSTRSGTSWSLPSEPGLAQSPSTMWRPALR